VFLVFVNGRALPVETGLTGRWTIGCGITRGPTLESRSKAACDFLSQLLRGSRRLVFFTAVGRLGYWPMNLFLLLALAAPFAVLTVVSALAFVGVMMVGGAVQLLAALKSDGLSGPG
jgi:hypothetical protein